MKRRLAYIVPEFPGQTHTWIWREMLHLREWGVEWTVFSTRRPSERDRARHAFAGEAEGATRYLWPASGREVLGALAWAALARPLAFASCVWMLLTLPIDRGPRWKKVWPLIVPGCVLSRRLRRGGFAHAHAHSCASSAVLCMIARRLAGVTYSLTLNANVEWWGGAMERKFGESRFVIVITRWLLAQCERDFPAIAGRFRLGRIGVDTRRWKPRAHERSGAGGVLRLASVGRLHPSKGFDVLIRAVGLLRDRGEGATLRLIGAGPAREELERLIAELRLGGAVTLEGSRSEDEIIEVLGAADVFVLSSHAEPLGVVVMEAMALGVATVGTRAGGVGEIIENGVDGLLVEPGSPEVLADALSCLAGDPALRARLGRAGREKVVRAFDSRIGARTLHELVFGEGPDEGAEVAAREREEVRA